jgi:hypothetical protein
MNITKSFGKLAAVVALALSAFGSAHAVTTTIASGLNGASLVTVGTAVSATNIQYRVGTTGAFGLVPTTSAPGVVGPGPTGPQHPYAANPGSGYAAALPGSRWITPYEVTATGVPSSVAPVGYYDYKTRFSVANLQQGLSGKFLSDNQVTAVLIDGHALSFTNGSPTWSSPGTFGFAAGAFSVGLHTLEFIVYNSGGATALDFNGVLSPEPATIIAFAIAFLCIGAMMIRARKRDTSMVVTA